MWHIFPRLLSATRLQASVRENEPSLLAKPVIPEMKAVHVSSAVPHFHTSIFSNFSDMIPSSLADNVQYCMSWQGENKCKGVKRLGWPLQKNLRRKDWLFLDPSKISEAWNDVKYLREITSRISPTLESLTFHSFPKLTAILCTTKTDLHF